MESVKFDKDSPEFKMFTDYWHLVQKYYKIGYTETDDVFNAYIEDVNNFMVKYGSIKLSDHIDHALMNYVNERRTFLRDKET